MRYRIRHLTHYDYDHEISVSHHVVRARPRDLPHQVCHTHRLDISPAEATQTSHQDSFGNETVLLTVERPHQAFGVAAHSEVEVSARPFPKPESTPRWEQVRDQCQEETTVSLEAARFLYNSPLAPRSVQLRDWASPHFPPGRPLLLGLLSLMHTIHQEFTFDPTATHVSTPVAEILRKRRGVCQDFAHLTLACLRSLGLPARYVSGYLETRPAPGHPKLVGADASHAWVSAFCPGGGWIDLDPTNDILPGEQHVTVAWGRDYGDVSPVRGVLVGAGDHRLRVSVDVEPLPARQPGKGSPPRTS